MVTFSIEETAFRRGFTHGYWACLRGGTTPEEVKEWDRSQSPTCPPGTGMAGHRMDCLINENMYYMNKVSESLFSYMNKLDDESFKKFYEIWVTFCEMQGIPIYDQFEYVEPKDLYFRDDCELDG